MAHRNLSTRRNVLRSVGVGTAGIGLAGCLGGDDELDDLAEDADGADDTSGSDGSRLIYSQQVDPIQLDPLVVGDIYSYQIINRVFDPLYEFGEGTEIVPKVAVDEPTIERDGQRYIIELRDDVRFHDGEPLTAEDVEHTYTAPVEEAELGDDALETIDSIDLIDDHTVQIDLEFGFVPFQIEVLTNNIVSKEARTADREAYNTEPPIGSGPYELTDWQQGEYAELTRFEDYWDDPLPNVETLRMVPVEEDTTRATRLQTGESDVIDGIPPQIWDTVEGMENADLMEEPGINYFFAAFNCNQGPTADPLVREAVDYAFSMDQAVSNFVEPAGTRNHAPLPLPVVEEWDMPIEEWREIPHDRDQDRAAELMDEAGVPDDYEFTILSPPDDIREQIAVSIGNGLQDIGYDTQVQRLEWGAFLDNIDTGDDDDYNIYLLGYLNPPDPDVYFTPLFHESNAGNAPNGVFYENDDVMEKITTARQSADFEERRELYIDVATQILEDRVHLPAYSPKTTLGVGHHVHDFVAHPRQRLNPRMVGPTNNVSIDN